MTTYTLEEAITRFIPAGFADEDGVWHDGPHRQEALNELGALTDALRFIVAYPNGVGDHAPHVVARRALNWRQQQ